MMKTDYINVFLQTNLQYLGKYNILITYLQLISIITKFKRLYNLSFITDNLL